MQKVKKKTLISVIAILCIGVLVFLELTIFDIEKHTWILFSAQQAQAPYFVVAHDKGIETPDDPLFQFSKPVELICEAKNGKLVLTDKTNGKTYEGTYKISSFGWGKRVTGMRGQSYTVVIDGLEGTANISSRLNRTLFVSIGGYYLQFQCE